MGQAVGKVVTVLPASSCHHLDGHELLRALMPDCRLDIDPLNKYKQHLV